MKNLPNFNSTLIDFMFLTLSLVGFSIALLGLYITINDSKQKEVIRPVVHTYSYENDTNCVAHKEGLYVCVDSDIWTVEEVKSVIKKNQRDKNEEIVNADLLEFTGKVSYYSHDGCEGCNTGQIMANGEAFDETNYTLAFNHLPLNTWVEVHNLDTGKMVLAKVTDRGGFNSKGRELSNVPENGLERLADLSKGLCEAIECKTDVSTIKIVEAL